MTRALLLIILLLPLQAQGRELHRERWYQEKYCQGETEHRLPDGARVDCLSDHHAIEYDFGKKWAECIGQAQYYSRKTDRPAGCVLINPSAAQLSRLLIGFSGAVWIVNESHKVRVR